MPTSMIESYHTNQDKLILSEKIILNSEGEERAKYVCNSSELQNMDVVYASNCVRTLQTAKYLLESQNLKVHIDDRFDERRVGIPNDSEVTDWFSKQYLEPDYKTIGGESQLDVQNRMSEALEEILEQYKDKRIAIFTHGYAITFFLLKYCKLLDIQEKKLTYQYQDKIIFDKCINAPEVFKLTYDHHSLENIELIEFDELPYNLGI